MRMSYFLATAISTLSAHQVPVTASVGSKIALTGVMSLGFLHLVDADQSVNDQPRFLRGNNIAESDNEERGFTFGEVEKMVNQLKNTNAFMKLKPAQKETLSAKADDFMVSGFKALDDLQMRPHDLDAQLRTIPEVKDALRQKAVDGYTNYLKEMGK
ncbi:RxLR effector protein [Phytophthora megakarya]|uniref:RxLR effector protein n=1 Tax=Phytophthora megakarya TaxID=4795 RepID=A0A225WXY6_9STRA|nr:RxLR effector protein [Phytophthora megakarya]